MAKDNSRGHGRATNGPYGWGNGPKPKGQGCCSYQEAGRALVRGRYRLAVRYVRMDVKARLGVI